MRFSILIVWCAIAVAQPQAQRLVIDGRLDDAFWKGLPAQKLVPSETGVPLDAGGEIRLAISGRYLYVAARLPEAAGRVTARVTGRNPNWEDEDLFQILAGPDIGYTDRVVKINALGAYSVEREGQLVHPNVDKYLVATRVSESGWTVELAFPLNLVSAPASDPVWVSMKRIRARRPGSPPQRWHWPEFGPASKAPVKPPEDWSAPGPIFQPSAIGNTDAPLQVGRVSALPAPDSKWGDPAWRNVPVWTLLKDEAPPSAPAAATEVKLIHDGQTLAVLARCTGVPVAVAAPGVPSRRASSPHSFQIYLATSGSSYVRLSKDASGQFNEAAGLTGGSRISRPREFSSGTRAAVHPGPDAWTVRMDIPLSPVAKVLGEAAIPPEWRVLFRRVRPGPEGELTEVSVLPVIGSSTPLRPVRYRRLALVDSVPSRPAMPAGAQSAPGPRPFDSRVLSHGRSGAPSPSDMVGRYVRNRVQAIAQTEQQAWERVQSRADWERFREPRLKALAASLGEFPPRSPLETKVTKEFTGEGYRRQDLVYQSRPGLWVTANLYLPANPPARMPGIVVVHSLHRPKSQAEIQDMGILWARAGCAVLAMDLIGHGERTQSHPWNREGYHARFVLSTQLYLAGESLAKWMVWDVIRGIDLLLERKDIAQDQIIVLGAVAGGGEPAALAAALDTRVAAVAPFNFGRSDPGSGWWDASRCLRRSVVDRFFPWVICASVAPRRLIYANEMGRESYRNPEAWHRYQKIYGLYGARDNLDDAYGFGSFPGPGECANIGPAQRASLYPELHRWFAIPIPPEEPDDRRPEPELASLTPALAATLKMRAIHELAAEVAQPKMDLARTQLAALPPGERLNRLRRQWAGKLGDVEANARPEATVHWKRPWLKAEAEGITLAVEPGITVPLVLLRPAAPAPGRLPVVIALSQGGKESFFAHRGREIEELLKAGAVVCLPDVRGTGETSPDTSRGPGGADVSHANTEFMLGSTLLGARLKDLRTVMAYLAGRSELDSRRFGLWGDSVAPVNAARLLLDELPNWQIGPDIQHQAEPLGGLLAILGALYEDGVRAVAVRRGLLSYRSILDDRFNYIPGDVIVPGVLEIGDITDAAAALAPRPLLFESLVDGRNRPVPDAALRSGLAPVYKAYNASPGVLQVRAEGATPPLARWIAAQF
jgi:cephalosporin-C deacetylase-like acetyl esterase